MKCLVMIPLYNEAETINSVIQELCIHHQGDVLIIDDGSTDNSTELLNDCVKKKLTLITHVENQGYGATISEGFRYAIENNYDVIITMDCDFQHEPKNIPEFIKQIESYDIVSGSRYLLKSKEQDDAPKDRAAINKTITKRIIEITGYDITDAFCGFKAYKTTALKKLSTKSTGYAMPLQLWIQAWKQDLTVKEIPVPRIYKNLNRSFGEELDNPETRLKYYNNVIDKELNEN